MGFAAQGLPAGDNIAFSERPTRRTAWFVAAVWAVLTASTLAYVYRHALTSPWSDELRWVPIITGAEPLTAKWVFKAENLHFLPLIKLAYMGLGRATGFDFRAPAFLNPMLLAAAALAMILVVAQTRQRASVLDILIPVVLLHWGHYVNLIWGFQLCFALATALACLLLLLVSLDRPQLSVGRAGLACACTIAAALCGGPGIFYLLGMAVWLAYAGIRRWHDHRPAAITILILAALTLLPLGLWVATLPEVKGAAATSGHGLRLALLGTLQCLSMSLGKFGGETYPFSGLAVVVLVAMAGAVLCRVWRREPPQRLRAAGLGLFLCGALSMALGIGLTRGSIGCLQNRYILLGSPLILCLYLIGAYYGPAIRRRGMRWACAAALVGLAIAYDVKGLRLTPEMEGNVRRLEASVREGLPVEALAARYYDDMQEFSEAALARDLDLLRMAGVGPYRRTQPIACARDVVVAPLLPLAASRIPSDIKMLRGRDELVQPFVPTRALPLYRIDVEASPSRCTALRFHWAIDELDATGQGRTRAQGVYAFDDRANQGYAQLVFEPFTTTPQSRLELRIGLDGDGQARLRVPQYPLQSGHRQLSGVQEVGVRGFSFYDRDAGLPPRPH